ncbi:MAG: hypothetical protein ACLQPD_16870 [Desulfomonilaceae bacterium]
MKIRACAVFLLSFLAISNSSSFAQSPFTGAKPFNYPQSTLSKDTRVGTGWFGSFPLLEPAFLPPRLFAAGSPSASSIKVAATANVYADALNNGQGLGNIEWSTSGLWLGLSLPVQVNRWLWADLQGWYFFPSNSHVDVSGQASGLINGVFNSLAVSENLDINTTWFATDLEGSFRVSSDFAVLGGVRYDYLQGTIRLPDSLEALVPSTFPGLRTKLDVSLNSLFPYFGVRRSISTGQGTLTFYLKGFPWAVSVAKGRRSRGILLKCFFRTT